MRAPLVLRLAAAFDFVFDALLNAVLRVTRPRRRAPERVIDDAGKRIRADRDINRHPLRRPTSWATVDELMPSVVEVES